jgi:predicted amidophosphoribosyltransferase
LGFSLDKHTVKSTPLGPNELGHMQFKTIRTTAGEALFQLKYRSDYSQIPIIARNLYPLLRGRFEGINLVVPMPPSKKRKRQPVIEIAQGIYNVLVIDDFTIPVHHLKRRHMCYEVMIKSIKFLSLQ